MSKRAHGIAADLLNRLPLNQQFTAVFCGVYDKLCYVKFLFFCSCSNVSFKQDLTSSLQRAKKETFITYVAYTRASPEI